MAIRVLCEDDYESAIPGFVPPWTGGSVCGTCSRTKVTSPVYRGAQAMRNRINAGTGAGYSQVSYDYVQAAPYLFFSRSHIYFDLAEANFIPANNDQFFMLGLYDQAFNMTGWLGCRNFAGVKRFILNYWTGAALVSNAFTLNYPIQARVWYLLDFMIYVNAANAGWIKALVNRQLLHEVAGLNNGNGRGNPRGWVGLANNSVMNANQTDCIHDDTLVQLAPVDTQENVTLMKKVFYSSLIRKRPQGIIRFPTHEI